MKNLNIYIIKGKNSGLLATESYLKSNEIKYTIVNNHLELKNKLDIDLLLLSSEYFIKKSANRKIRKYPHIIFSENGEKLSNVKEKNLMQHPFDIEQLKNKIKQLNDDVKKDYENIPLHFYKKIVQHTSDVMTIIDIEGKVIFISPSVENVLGYIPSEFIGQNVFELMTPEDIFKIQRQLVLSANEFNKANKLEFNIKNKFDVYIPFEGVISNYCNDESIGGYIINARDVSERKKADAIIKNEKDILSAILINAPFGLILLSKNWELEFLNREFNRIFGYSRNDLHNFSKWLEMIFPVDLYGELLQDEYSVKMLRDGLVKVYKIKTKKNTYKDVEFRVNSLKDGRKLITFLDTTEKKLSEEAIRNSVDQLVANKFLIENRNKELKNLNNKLVESEKQLKELNVNKDKFMSILAHDLRGPFNALLGMAHITIADYDELQSSELKMLLQEIYNASKHTYNLLENLLSWAKVSSGIVEYRPEPFLLNDLINQLFLGIQHIAKNKEITLSFIKPEDNYKVYADLTMVYSIVQNLVSNAIKFTPRNGVVTINVKKNKNEVIISVEDTGVGMGKNKVEELFKINHSTTLPGTENEKGSGLGLLICKEFVEKNKGKIWAESKISQGTKFFFTLPFFSP